MSDNKKELKGEVSITSKESKDNDIKISDDVVAVIAGVAVSEVSGVASMAGGFAGEISGIFSGKKNMQKGIKVEIEGDVAKIDVNIIVEYGIRIPDVAFEIQNKVKKSVETMTGLKVDEVNVHIQGVDTEAKEEKDEKKEAKKEVKKIEEEKSKKEATKKSTNNTQKKKK
jgi:uncharacterized alkaline shock family protein YloU